METPDVGLREWIAGARPVVGAVGACGLMLAACSLFVLRPGDLGASSDVGTPAPVQIGDADVVRHPVARTPVDLRNRASQTSRNGASAAEPADTHVTRPTTARTRHDRTAPAVDGPTGTSERPPTPTRPTASAPAPASTSVTAPPATPTVPTPAGELPDVPLPPVAVTVPVPLPPLPAVAVPDLSKTTSKLGLP